MTVVWSLRALLVRGAALLVAFSLSLGPTPLSASAGEHCNGHHRIGTEHPRQGAEHPRVAADLGTSERAGTPADCPHCGSAQCAFLAPCAAGGAAVTTGRMPQVAGADPVRSVGPALATRARSLSVAPPTPPPLATP